MFVFLTNPNSNILRGHALREEMLSRTRTEGERSSMWPLSSEVAGLGMGVVVLWSPTCWQNRIWLSLELTERRDQIPFEWLPHNRMQTDGLRWGAVPPAERTTGITLAWAAAWHLPWWAARGWVQGIHMKGPGPTGEHSRTISQHALDLELKTFKHVSTGSFSDDNCTVENSFQCPSSLGRGVMADRKGRVEVVRLNKEK